MGWTNEQVDELCRLWDKGLTANEIAKKLGVTKNAIVGKVHRLCLKARPSPIKFKGEVEPAEPAKLEENGDAVETSELEDTEVQNNVEESAPSNVSTCDCGKIKLVELDSHTCRWPIGDPRDEDFGFCGRKVRAGQTYCDEHSAMAYVKANRR